MRISDWSSDVCSSDLLLVMRLDLVGEKTHDRVAEQLQFFVAHHPASGLLQKFVARELSRARSGSDRKSAVLGKSVSVRVDHGGRRIIKQKTHKFNTQYIQTLHHAIIIKH